MAEEKVSRDEMKLEKEENKGKKKKGFAKKEEEYAEEWKDEETIDESPADTLTGFGKLPKEVEDLENVGDDED